MAGAAGHKYRRWRLSGNKIHVDTVRNDINVTPLVDVMLVLLIIFMLMTLVMGRGHDVKLPNAKNFSEEKDQQQPVVTIAGESDEFAVWVEKTRIGPFMKNGKVDETVLKSMETLILAQWKNPTTVKAGGAGKVYLKAEIDVTYERIFPVLHYIHKNVVTAEGQHVESIDVAIAKGDK
jgi:biopolymer transport protein ExbD